MQCLQAEPRHGDIWCLISKDSKHWKMSNRDILQIVVDKIPPIETI